MSFTIEDVLYLLGINVPDGRRNFYVQCPICDAGKRRKRLNINVDKDGGVFRCNGCGVAGKKTKLYAFMNGMDLTDLAPAAQEIKQRLGLPEEERKSFVRHERAREQRALAPVMSTIADIKNRDYAYGKLLGHLTLASDHRINLQNRGLSDDEIDMLGYKTTPACGFEVFCKALKKTDDVDFEGVPGFYKLETGSWSYSAGGRGILIPIRDKNGMIQGLQLRRDDTSTGKFRWVSSGDKQDGSKAETWTHIAGPFQEEVLLTEGPMKADIIHFLSGRTVLAIPGVSCLTHLEEVLLDFKKMGMKKVMVAFDMDMYTNPNVLQAFNNLAGLLERLQIYYGNYYWDPNYKGLDDYLWHLEQGD